MCYVTILRESETIRKNDRVQLEHVFWDVEHNKDISGHLHSTEGLMVMHDDYHEDYLDYYDDYHDMMITPLWTCNEPQIHF